MIRIYLNSKCPAIEIRERLDDSPSWYREHEDPRIHPTFAALSPFWRCRKLVTFSRKVVLTLQANVALKPPFNSRRTDVSFVLHP